MGQTIIKPKGENYPIPRENAIKVARNWRGNRY
jgi:hypothetical protein